MSVRGYDWAGGDDPARTRAARAGPMDTPWKQQLRERLADLAGPAVEGTIHGGVAVERPTPEAAAAWIGAIGAVNDAGFCGAMPRTVRLVATSLAEQAGGRRWLELTFRYRPKMNRTRPACDFDALP